MNELTEINEHQRKEIERLKSLVEGWRDVADRLEELYEQAKTNEELYKKTLRAKQLTNRKQRG